MRWLITSVQPNGSGTKFNMSSMVPKATESVLVRTADLNIMLVACRVHGVTSLRGKAFHGSSAKGAITRFLNVGDNADKGN